MKCQSPLALAGVVSIPESRASISCFASISSPSANRSASESGGRARITTPRIKKACE